MEFKAFENSSRSFLRTRRQAFALACFWQRCVWARGKNFRNVGSRPGSPSMIPSSTAFPVEPALGEIPKDTLPEIGPFPVAHHQGQNLEAFIFFRDSQHRTKA